MEGDFFKLGKIIFLVRKIKIHEDDIKKLNESYTSNFMDENDNNNNNGNNNGNLNNSINEELIIYNNNKKNTNILDKVDSAKTISERKNKENEKDKKNENNTNNNNLNSINNKLKYLYIKLKNVNEKNLKPLKCRICFCEGTFEDKNPLISPCNCTGSVKYIHLNCLRKWLTSKINIKSSPSGNIYFYSFKNLECEICKAIIPEQVEFRGTIISLLDFKDIDPPYLILQTMNQYSPQSKNIEYNIIFVMSFKVKNYLMLGRSSNSDIKLNDISVSRNHSVISYDYGKFYIHDIGSKFGTLLLIQNNILFLPYKEMTIQAGACHLIFYIIRTLMGCLKCHKNKKFNDFTYEKYFESQDKEIYSQILDHLNNNIVDPIEKYSSIDNSYNSDYKNNNVIVDDEKDNDNNDKNTLNENNSNININNALDIDKTPTININEIKNNDNNCKINKTGSFIINRLSDTLNSNPSYTNHNEFQKQNESNEMLFQDINKLNESIRNFEKNGRFSIMNILKKNNNKNNKHITYVKNNVNIHVYNKFNNNNIHNTEINIKNKINENLKKV